MLERHDFYRLYANIPLGKRDIVLNQLGNHPLSGMTLSDVYIEIKEIDDKLRSDEIRRDKLLRGVEDYLNLLK